MVQFAQHAQTSSGLRRVSSRCSDIENMADIIERRSRMWQLQIAVSTGASTDIADFADAQHDRFIGKPGANIRRETE